MSDDPGDAPSAREHRARPVDRDALDLVLARSNALPEPIAALLLEVELASDEGDHTGVRKRLYELAIGVVRYGVSIGLGALAATSAGSSAPGPVADTLRKACRLTDGKWFELVRVIAGSLKQSAPAIAKSLAFVSGSAASGLVASRNAFIHGGGTGDDAAEKALAVLDAAKLLLALPLRAVAEGGVLEIRHGVPKRRGVWKKADGEPAVSVGPGSVFARVGDEVVRVDPWLPLVDGELRLVDSPYAQGKSWRCIFPETGEHRDAPLFQSALVALVGDDGHAPRAPTDKPLLVGRAAAISLVQRALAEGAEGCARVVVMTGPQGAGLTRLATEAAAAAAGYGFTEVVSAFGSMDRRRPFGALSLALEGAIDALAPLKSALARVTSGRQIETRTQLDAEIEAIEEGLIAASRETAIVLTVDDAQWLDEASLALLGLLAERADRGARGRLTTLIGIRQGPSTSAALARIIALAERHVGDGVTRAVLEPLARGDTELLVERVAPSDREVIDLVATGSAGLPFFIVHPLHVWIESGALEWTEGVWSRAPGATDRLAAGVPGLADLVVTRLAALFDAGSDAERVAHQILACLTADGAPTPPGRLERALGLAEVPPVLGERVLETLLSAAIVVDGGPLGLRVPQPIVAQALASTYRARPWWRRLQRALLTALAEEPLPLRDAERLARGFDALGDEAAALGWYRAAVTQRLTQGAFDDARALAELVASRETALPERLRAELQVVDAIHRNGAASAARERHMAIDVPDAPRLVLEWSVVGEELAVAAGLPPIGDLDALVARADAEDDARLRVAARVVVARRRRGGDGRATIRDALSILDREPDAGASDARYRLLALDVELVYETKDGGVEALRAAAAKAAAAAQQLGSLWAELDAENDVAILESDMGDTVGAIARLDRIATSAAAAHYGSLRRLALTNACALQLRRGELGVARERAAIIEASAREAGDGKSLAQVLSIRAETELGLGDAGAALRAIDECIALRDRAGERNLTIALLRRADIKAHTGDEDGARADAELALVHATEAENVDHASLARLWPALRGATRADLDPEQRRRAMDALRGVVDQVVAVETKLRPPTRKRLAEARALLPARG